MYIYTFVSYPNNVNPTKKYPIKNILKFTANAQTKIEQALMIDIKSNIDLLPIFDDI